jgi:hypothetical protein
MKTIEVRKDFLMELHKSVPEILKKEIENELPDLFKPKNKVGGWVQDISLESGKSLWFIEKIDGSKSLNNPVLSYGFDMDGDWDDSSYRMSELLNSQLYRPATEEEVQEALINEAKKRGFKNGVKYNDVSIYKGIKTLKMFDNIKCYIENDNQLTDGCGGSIFCNGKWAEIIDDKAKLKEAISRLEKELTNLKSQL